MRIIYILFVVTFFFLLSCSQKQQTKAGAPNVKMALASHDTLQVTNLVIQFMDALQDKRYADAVVMLHKVDPESPYSEPELLDNDELEKTIYHLKRFPIRSYKIKEIDFKIAYDNEVKCIIETEPFVVGQQSMSLNFSLKPVRYLGHWSLCLYEN